MKNNKNTIAVVLFALGIFYSIIPFRGWWGLFTNATDAEMGIVALMFILTGVIIYFMPENKN